MWSVSAICGSCRPAGPVGRAGSAGVANAGVAKLAATTPVPPRSPRRLRVGQVLEEVSDGDAEGRRAEGRRNGSRAIKLRADIENLASRGANRPRNGIGPGAIRDRCRRVRQGWENPKGAASLRIQRHRPGRVPSRVGKFPATRRCVSAKSVCDVGPRCQVVAPGCTAQGVSLGLCSTGDMPEGADRRGPARTRPPGLPSGDQSSSSTCA